MSNCNYKIIINPEGLQYGSNYHVELDQDFFVFEDTSHSGFNSETKKKCSQYRNFTSSFFKIFAWYS